MLMLDQISRLCEEFAASTSTEEHVRIAKLICDECVSVIRKRWGIKCSCFSVDSHETAMQYYGVSAQARAIAKRVEKQEGDEYKASVIIFYANTLAQKSLVLADYYHKVEANDEK